MTALKNDSTQTKYAHVVRQATTMPVSFFLVYFLLVDVASSQLKVIEGIFADLNLKDRFSSVFNLSIINFYNISIRGKGLLSFLLYTLTAY